MYMCFFIFIYGYYSAWKRGFVLWKVPLLPKPIDCTFGSIQFLTLQLYNSIMEDRNVQEEGVALENLPFFNVVLMRHNNIAHCCQAKTCSTCAAELRRTHCHGSDSKNWPLSERSISKHTHFYHIYLKSVLCAFAWARQRHKNKWQMKKIWRIVQLLEPGLSKILSRIKYKKSWGNSEVDLVFVSMFNYYLSQYRKLSGSNSSV